MVMITFSDSKFTENRMEWWLSNDATKVYLESHGVSLTQQDLENMLEKLKRAKEGV